MGRRDGKSPPSSPICSVRCLPPLRPFLPSFHHALIDLMRIDDEARRVLVVWMAHGTDRPDLAGQERTV